MKKLKVKLFVNGPFLLSRVPSDNGMYPYVNPVFLYLKKYHDMYGKFEVDWEYPCLYKTNVEEDLKVVDECAPDVVAFVMHVWNHDHNLRSAELIKKKYPDIKIVFGGPNLVAHKTDGFFEDHPYVDYVVYGDGEKPFTQLLDYMLAEQGKEDFVNIVTREKVYPYEQMADPDYMTQSPVLSQQDYFLKTLEYNKGILKDFFGKSIISFNVGVEFARGCMYNCTFCDWGQNLSKKVKRRKYDWRADIDFYHKHDLSISETDANFGQWPEDIVIYDYCASLYDPARNFRFITINSPKLKKDVTEYFFIQNIKIYGSPRNTISLQDIDDTVLKNIERPSISWEDHRKMIARLRGVLTPDEFRSVQAQFILGLPGQTVDTLKRTITQTLIEGITSFNCNLWFLLPNSPAADPFYQRLHNLKFSKVFVMIDKELEADSADEIYAQVAARTGLFHRVQSIGDVISSTRYLKHSEIHAAQETMVFFERRGYRYVDGVSEEYLTYLVDRVYNAIIERRVGYAKDQEPLIEKYGFYIKGYFDTARKKFIRY